MDFGMGLYGLGIGLGAGLAILGGAIATAWAQSSIGAGGMGLMAEKDGMQGNVLIMLALPETIVILAFVAAFFLIGKLAGA
jgi:V/A-type H+-transporting ATPase subunit K